MRSLDSILPIVAAGAIAMTAVSCAPEPTARSVVLITLDTTRADHLGPYGYPEAETPVFDRLATEGVVFERAYSPVPETLPAHSSIMTGLYPPSHGVRLNLSFRLPNKATTLAEILRGQGLRTAAVTSAVVLDAKYGLDQGFERYSEVDPGSGSPERSGEEVTELALAAAADFGEQPFFLWAHYYDPHSPFEPRPPFEAEENHAPESVPLYDREIAYMDHWVGELLDGLAARGQLEEALIVIVGDHGESLGDHGETYHTLFVYEATQHVPLLLSGPGMPRGARVPDLVSSIDVFATILGGLGFDAPGEISSRPLPGIGLADARPDQRRAIFSESMAAPLRFSWAALQAVRIQDWLYIRAPTEELYDLSNDPDENFNLVYSEAEQLEDLRSSFRSTLTRLPIPSWNEQATHQPSEGERQALETLGYLTGSQGTSLDEPLEGEDPKDMVEVAEAYQLARLALRRQRPETAAELLRFVTSVNPDGYGGWLLFGQTLGRLRAFEEARLALERALALQPSSWRALLDLAAVDQRLGDLPAAEWNLRRALAGSPFPGEVWRGIARLKLAARDLEAAQEAYREVLSHLPGDARATQALAAIEAREVPAGATEAHEFAGDLGAAE